MGYFLRSLVICWFSSICMVPLVYLAASFIAAEWLPINPLKWQSEARFCLVIIFAFMTLVAIKMWNDFSDLETLFGNSK